MGKTKTIDPAVVQKKLSILEPQLAQLQKQAEAETDPKKKLKLGRQVDRTRDKIRQAKTGERFSRQTKRDLVAYSFIAPNFIGFAIFTLGPVIFAFVLAFLKWDGNNAMEFAGLSNFAQMVGNKRFLAAFRNTVIYCVATVPFTLAVKSEDQRTEFLQDRQFFPLCGILSGCGSGVEHVVLPGQKRPGQYDSLQSWHGSQAPSQVVGG